MIGLLKKKSLEDKLNALEEKMRKNLPKKKFEKVENLIVQYNELIDNEWSIGPSRYPLQKIDHIDKENLYLIFEIDKCDFCGSDDRDAIEILPYLFGTIKFIGLCKKEECQATFKNYKENYLNILDQAHEDLSKYDLNNGG